jgi:hypothetical protein
MRRSCPEALVGRYGIAAKEMPISWNNEGMPANPTRWEKTPPRDIRDMDRDYTPGIPTNMIFGETDR